MSRLAYFFRETTISLRRNLLMTLAGILTVAVSLSLVGGVWLVLRVVQHGTSRWRDGVELEIFMNTDATQGQIGDVQAELDSLIDQEIVERYTFFTKQMAFDYFNEVFQDQPELVENVTPELLPTSFRVVPTEPELTREIRTRFEGWTGVDTVIDADEAVKDMLTIINWVVWAIIGLAIALLVASAFLIVNTIRLATFARRREIEVMKLVGASNWFVRVPFMAEGLAQGLVGAGLAVGAVWALKVVLSNALRDTSETIFSSFFVTSGDASGIGFVVLGIGAVIGLLGAALGLRRFLDV